MTAPAQGNGYRQMPGGYDPSGQYATQQFAPQGQQQAAPPMPRMMQQQPGMPAYMGGPQMPQEAGWTPPPQFQQQQQQAPLTRQEIATQMMPPQYQQQQQQAPNPNMPPAGYGQQNQMPFQQQQPQQGVPAQGIDPNVRLTGPGIPPELQGRTLAEGIATYQGLRNMSLQLMQQMEQRPQVQQQAPAQGAPQSGPQQGQQAQAQPGDWDWKNPKASVGAAVQEALQQTLVPMLAPMAAQNNMQAVRSAMGQAAAEFGNQWPRIEAQVMQQLTGADPQALMNPRVWATAARAVWGELNMPGRQQQVPQNQMPNQPGAYPIQQVGQIQNPSPNLNTFFTEQPNQGGAGVAPVQLSPMQEWARQAMGMDYTTYVAWAGGIQTGGR